MKFPVKNRRCSRVTNSWCLNVENEKASMLRLSVVVSWQRIVACCDYISMYRCVEHHKVVTVDCVLEEWQLVLSDPLHLSQVLVFYSKFTFDPYCRSGQSFCRFCSLWMSSPKRMWCKTKRKGRKEERERDVQSVRKWQKERQRNRERQADRQNRRQENEANSIRKITQTTRGSSIITYVDSNDNTRDVRCCRIPWIDMSHY
jgi:hypothetical protein